MNNLTKFTQRKVKIANGGLFFKGKELERKFDRLGVENNFFKPFNSVFERQMFVMKKQTKGFNNHAGMNVTATKFYNDSDLPQANYRGHVDQRVKTASLAKINTVLKGSRS